MAKRTAKKGKKSREAVGYVRVSTTRQAVDGNSLDQQEARIIAFCEAHGYAKPEIFSDEGISAKKASNRPGLQEAIARACANKGVLVVTRFDRFARNLREGITLSERLDRCGANLVSITDSIDTTTANGRAFFAIVGVFSTLERETTGERMRDFIEAKREKGERYTKITPFGFRLVERNGSERYEKDPKQQRVIRRMLGYREKGWGFSRIATHLNESGVSPPQGKAWYPMTVKRVLEREGE